MRALRRQWRGYAAGRAWLGRRYDDFEPEPALRRAAGRLLRRSQTAALPACPGDGRRLPGATGGRPVRAGPGRFMALDALLGVEELAGFALSNRPRREDRPAARVVLVADRFPAREDPLADFALSLAGARVEAAARPPALDAVAARGLIVDYREDDGAAARALALGRLCLGHPLRCARDAAGRLGGPGATPPPWPRSRPPSSASDRIPRRGSRPLGGPAARAVAAGLARLAGRGLAP